jgi:iron complex outermembrane receptor protein
VYCGPVSVPGSFTANPDLRPEKSDSWTAGFVWEPVRDLSIGMDYYFIKQKDLVSSRDFQFILDNEARYAQYVTRGAPTSDDLARGAPGPLVIVAVPFENLSKVETKGIDLDARYRWSVGGGRITVSANGSYIISFKQPLAPEEPPTELAGTYDLPRFRGLGSLAWDSGPWAATAIVNYVRGFQQSTAASATADERIEDWTTFDLQAAYSGWKNLKFTVGVKNVADKEPPLAIVEALLYSFQSHNVRGRFFYTSLNYRFR